MGESLARAETERATALLGHDGDPRDEDKVNHGLAALSDVIKRGPMPVGMDEGRFPGS